MTAAAPATGKHAPIDPLAVRLELIRNDVGVEMTIVAGLADVAIRCIALGEDDLLARTMANARDRMRLAITALKQLEAARADAAISAEAAVEFRAQRDGRRGRG